MYTSYLQVTPGGGVARRPPGRRRGPARPRPRRPAPTNVPQALTNPITVGKAPRPIPAGVAAGGGKAALKVTARPAKGAADGKKRAYTFTVRSNGGALLDGVKVSFLGGSGVTDSLGRVTILAKAPSKAGAKV